MRRIIFVEPRRAGRRSTRRFHWLSGVKTGPLPILGTGVAVSAEAAVTAISSE
jgi:hypothetical protein